jgi:hypothetical protein
LELEAHQAVMPVLRWLRQTRTAFARTIWNRMSWRLSTGKAMNDTYDKAYTLGQVDALSYQVSKGKPAAVVAARLRDLKDAVEIAGSHGAKVHAVENGIQGWLDLWIYKLDVVLEVIKSAPKTPSTPADHWLLGKLFGYSDEEIERYVKGIAAGAHECPVERRAA